MNHDDARAIFAEYLRSDEFKTQNSFMIIDETDGSFLTISGDQAAAECVILDDLTIERDWGWVFFYNLQKCVRSSHLSCVGPTPYFVIKDTGEVLITGTAFPIDRYMEAFEDLRSSGKDVSDFRSRARAIYDSERLQKERKKKAWYQFWR